MNKNKILSGGGKNLTGGGKWGWRGREVGGEGEGSGVKGGGKWGERGREVGVGYPPVHPLMASCLSASPRWVLFSQGLKRLWYDSNDTTLRVIY